MGEECLLINKFLRLRGKQNFNLLSFPPNHQTVLHLRELEILRPDLHQPVNVGSVAVIDVTTSC